MINADRTAGRAERVARRLLGPETEPWDDGLAQPARNADGLFVLAGVLGAVLLIAFGGRLLYRAVRLVIG